jgi:hypothetical protein
MTPEQVQLLNAGVLRGIAPGNPYGAGAAGNPFTPSAPVPAVDPRFARANRDTSGQEGDIAMQQRRAQALLAQSQQSPGLIQAGRVSHAGASPMSALAQGIQGWSSGKASAGAREGASALAKTQADRAAALGSLAAEQADIDAAALARETAREDADDEAAVTALALTAANRAADRKYAVEDRDIADQNAIEIANIRKAGQQGQGLGVPAAIETGILRNTGTVANIGEVITEIETLAEQGKATSGAKRALVNLVPGDWRGIAEDLAFGAEEQKTSAKLTALDLQMMKAVNSDRLSDADARLLSGIRASIGGLTPLQQIGRLQAADEIMTKYGMGITGEEEESEVGVSVDLGNGVTMKRVK